MGGNRGRLRLETTVTAGISGERFESLKVANQLCGKRKAEVCRLPVCLRCLCWLLAITACLLSASLSAYAQNATKSPAKLPTLTKANDVHSLSNEEAKRAFPVHLRAVVTYFDPIYGDESASMFVHDASGGLYVNLPKSFKNVLTPGTLVDVQGVSHPGGFAPIVDQVQVKVLGRAPLPSNPHRVSNDRLHSGLEDCQWVEVEGLVRSAVEHKHNVRLMLQMETGIIRVVMVREAGSTYSNLVDAKVRLRATAAPLFNKYSQMISVRLLAPGLSAVKILEPAEGDPFQQPVIPIDDLLRWKQVNNRYHREHLHGTVTLEWPWPGSLVCIRDAERGICAHTDQDPHLALGDQVDMVGFVGAATGVPVIEHPLFRKVAHNENIFAEPITVEQILKGKSDSELIQIDGQLIGYSQTNSDITLLLTSGANNFSAVLPRKLAGTNPTRWKIGSSLRIMGICSTRMDIEGSAATEGIAEAESFSVLMRSPQDAAILESPSWWTQERTLAMLALAVLITLIVLGWVMALRKQVARQTILLRESEQRFRHMALHDSLTGLATRLLLRDRLNTAVETANRNHTGLALLMLDLDNFKFINDTLGHRAGDEVLRITAIRLQEVVRKSDTVARMGGERVL